MKLTKNILREHRFYNSYDIAKITPKQIFIDYCPADNGRLTSQYARWVVIKIGYQTNSKGHWKDNYNKTFTVTCRDEKQSQLQIAIDWVKEKYGIILNEKDLFGAYHPEGTLRLVENVIKSKSIILDNKEWSRKMDKTCIHGVSINKDCAKCKANISSQEMERIKRVQDIFNK